MTIYCVHTDGFIYIPIPMLFIRLIDIITTLLYL
jgi:hypothetical protein